ncbi:DUF1353 domain-containing protein [Fulvimarina sp. 2208YS6-2-32]|uniref:DUF1353 domain-containing protein n=1 Tax=Fulvimarina uroteuthidis TaxID=3098149 RepID=A0ABU5HYX6_9HYPH|nr:DUF1353 domain-containing protein [Fulvimarina sp. 2208YS6-2-32]MDY8108245.1 DUF1353 domain-containing protein [Fulvimarina sp. 2208YS6-2-32]
MSAYTEPLSYRSTDYWRNGRRLYELEAGFTFYSELAQRSITVPVGFLTDLGSIPAFARWWLSSDDFWAQAYVLHDRLYHTREMDRATADLILWEALGLPYRVYDEDGVMRRETCPALARSAIYQAVRIGGGPAYQRGG